MPHLEAVPGIDALIKVNGLNATEYINNDEVTAGPYQVVRYIEAVPDAEFTIKGAIHKTFQHWDTDLAVAYYVDGQFARLTLYRREGYTHPTFKFSCRGAVRDSSAGVEELPFKFASLVTSMVQLPLYSLRLSHLTPLPDEDQPLDAETAGKATHLGTVRVTVCRARYAGVDPILPDRKGPSEIDSVSEKALKGRSLSARTRYSSRKVCEASY
jgi:hypothetical protein